MLTNKYIHNDNIIKQCVMCNCINVEGQGGEVSVTDQGGIYLEHLRERGMPIFTWAQLWSTDLIFFFNLNTIFFCFKSLSWAPVSSFFPILQNLVQTTCLCSFVPGFP